MENDVHRLAEKIITLNPENKKIMVSIVDQLLISEAATKLGIKPIELRKVIDYRNVQHETKEQ